ncbi:Retinoblastoma-like protein 1 isoform X1 [Aix galericulata]|nr:Retinoblastoma-like protein 1 isoform X1 [Aix galericulata]
MDCCPTVLTLGCWALQHTAWTGQRTQSSRLQTSPQTLIKALPGPMWLRNGEAGALQAQPWVRSVTPGTHHRATSPQHPAFGGRGRGRGRAGAGGGELRADSEPRGPLSSAVAPLPVAAAAAAAAEGAVPFRRGRFWRAGLSAAPGRARHVPHGAAAAVVGGRRAGRRHRAALPGAQPGRGQRRRGAARLHGAARHLQPGGGAGRGPREGGPGAAFASPPPPAQRRRLPWQGEALHWLACALYVACRKSVLPTVGSGLMEGNCVSLTRILRSAKLRLTSPPRTAPSRGAPGLLLVVN